MRIYLFLVVLFSFSTLSIAKEVQQPVETIQVIETPTEESTSTPHYQENILKDNYDLRISVLGQGVSPMHTASPAQAFALAKRAAIADAYRLIAEKVAGVRVDGQDVIKNMMVQRSSIRTAVNAMVQNANVVETTFKDGLCEVEMEVVLSHSQFVQ